MLKNKSRWSIMVLLLIMMAGCRSGEQTPTEDKVVLQNEYIQIPEYKGMDINEVIRSSKLLVYDQKNTDAYLENILKTYEKLAEEKGYKDLGIFLKTELGMTEEALKNQLIEEREQKLKEENVIALVAEAEGIEADKEHVEEYLLTQTESKETEEEAIEFALYIINMNEDEIGLAGTEYQLYRNEALTDKVNHSSSVTDENGEVKISGLKTGKYYLLEVNAAVGYQKEREVKVIEIKEQDEYIEIYSKKGFIPM